MKLEMFPIGAPKYFNKLGVSRLECSSDIGSHSCSDINHVHSVTETRSRTLINTLLV